MGKKGRNRRREKQVVPTPSFESPVCPTCGKPDHVMGEGTDDDYPTYECTLCWTRFMYEDSTPDIETEDDDAEAAINMGSVAARDFNDVTPAQGMKCAICRGKNGVGADKKPCQVCKPKKKKDDTEYTTEPLFGDCEELTDAMAKRS